MFRTDFLSALTIDDLAELARQRLPRVLFDFLEGGAERELTLDNNRKAFDRYQLLPEILAGNGRRTLATELFGHRLSAPILIGPTGLNGIFWNGALLGLVAGHRGTRDAGDAGT